MRQGRTAFLASPWAPCLHLLPWSLKTSRWGLSGASTTQLSLGQLSPLRPLAAPRGAGTPAAIPAQSSPRPRAPPLQGWTAQRTTSLQVAASTDASWTRGHFSTCLPSLSWALFPTQRWCSPQIPSSPPPRLRSHPRKVRHTHGGDPQPLRTPGAPGAPQTQRVHAPTCPLTTCALLPRSSLGPPSSLTGHLSWLRTGPLCPPGAGGKNVQRRASVSAWRCPLLPAGGVES